jgi:hypothetical protein
MASPTENEEIGDLTEIYSTLKGDAKMIVKDLEGGVTMWREAAGANLAAAGFLLIMALTTFHYGPQGLEGTVLILAQIALGLLLLGYSIHGLRKYLRLRSRYQALFEKAKKLE